MSKLALASLCVSLLSCAAQQAEYYIDQLADSRRQVRLDASHALVQLGGAAVEPLLDRATTGSDSLRYITAQILGQIGDRRATPPSSNHSSATKIAISANSAVRALGQLDDPPPPHNLGQHPRRRLGPRCARRSSLELGQPPRHPRPCLLWCAP